MHDGGARLAVVLGALVLLLRPGQVSTVLHCTAGRSVVRSVVRFCGKGMEERGEWWQKACLLLLGMADAATGMQAAGCGSCHRM